MEKEYDLELIEEMVDDLEDPYITVYYINFNVMLETKDRKKSNIILPYALDFLDKDEAELVMETLRESTKVLKHGDIYISEVEMRLSEYTHYDEDNIECLH